MNRITTFQIPLRVEELRPPIFVGEVATPLAEPMQALVTAASHRAADAPFSVYLCADDDTTRARDDFAVALARTLAAHIPSTLVVDCDFLRPGLSDLVPQKDALGFLDYMLYGSSIGVITQDDDGVHMVGAGSFPVTKRMPFIDSAFTDAARRLVAHARCVMFVGPAFDGDGGRHPLTGMVDVVATVRTSARHPRLDNAEEQIASSSVEVWSVRLADAVAAIAPAAPAPARPERPAESVVAARPAPAPRPAPIATPGAPLPEPDALRPSSSLAPRIAVILFGLLVISFVVWWFLQNREPPRFGAENPPAGVTSTDSLRSSADTLAVRDTVVTPAVTTTTRPETTASEPPKPKPRPPDPGILPPPVDPGTRSESAGTGTRLVNSEDIQLMEDLDRRFNGWFIIHISSFQTPARARDEVAFLEAHDFPAFIVFLDLGPKGKWYRVYAGPYQTRDEARDVKKNLDAIPQVRFTRIASIPD